MNEFNKIVNQLPLDFPSRVALNIITYLYDESEKEIPISVKQNENFVVDKIKIS